MLAIVVARRAVVALHQDLDSLTSLPTLPRQELSEVEVLNKVDVLSEVKVLSEVEVFCEVLKLHNLDKDAFGKGEKLTSKLASVQKILQVQGIAGKLAKVQAWS